MTQDEIIRMAHEAGLYLATDVNWMPIIGLEYAENLVALARAAEREACETAVEDIARKYQQQHHPSAETIADECAAAIRARGQAIPTPPAGYTSEELERDNPYNQWSQS